MGWRSISVVSLWILIASAALVRAYAQPAEGFQSFLPRFELALSRFVNGDPVLWKQIASHREDHIIMGAWGAHEKGWAETAARYDWAAARFRPSAAKVKVEYLATGESGDIAYSISIERSAVHIIGQEKVAPMALRVTHIFRREEGTWRLIHRHADPIMTKTAPSATLQKSH
jgi:ketosteroid isomerase-like protein